MNIFRLPPVEEAHRFIIDEIDDSHPILKQWAGDCSLDQFLLLCRECDECSMSEIIDQLVDCLADAMRRLSHCQIEMPACFSNRFLIHWNSTLKQFTLHHQSHSWEQTENQQIKVPVKALIQLGYSVPYDLMTPLQWDRFFRRFFDVKTLSVYQACLVRYICLRVTYWNWKHGAFREWDAISQVSQVA